MRRGRATAWVGGVSVLLALTACSSPADDTAEEDRDEVVVEDTADGVEVPAECREAYAYAAAGGSLDDIEALPDGWPAAPGGSTLCVTADGGSVETASYVTAAPIEEVLAYYERELAGDYEVVRVDGAENGTGYDSLDGSGEAIGFQIRESDGGFVIAFVGGDESEGEEQ
ncbi:hypothetical protein BHE97_04135 [Aeromicrobium sp. PE09-221]|uniref:hypothetical protein n=1 Tax=Aeromicrobium sp. PE09-221 TaxID=1898043 RepID=UPI000B3EB4B2|nr:hypothetical protein [Aeromicrobium sp. PE09-221]OUZ11703.1 hypothetical protein BHE97_04135 [Aeromicrobium sp. PE09-221]